MDNPALSRGRLQRVWIRLAALAVATLALGAVPPALALDLGWLTPAVAGSGPVVAEALDVGRFDALRVSTGARVRVRQGDRPAVEVRGEGNVVPLVAWRLENGTPVVEDTRRFSSSTAEVVVTVRRLRAIAASGSTAVVAEGLKAGDLSIALGGSSTVNLRRATLGRLLASLGGSSALRATGSVGELSLDLGGASVVQAEQLQARSGSIRGGGSSQAVVWVTDALSVALGGSAGVGSYGAAARTLATSGSSSARYLGPAPPAQP